MNLVGVTRRVVGVELRRQRSTLHTKRSLQGSGSEKEGSERLLTPGRSDFSSSPGLWRGGAAGPRWRRAPCQQWRGGGGSGACWRLWRGVVRAPRGEERQIKEAAGVLGVRALDGRAGEDCGRDLVPCGDSGSSRCPARSRARRAASRRRASTGRLVGGSCRIGAVHGAAGRPGCGGPASRGVRALGGKKVEKMKPTGGPGQSATGKERMARVNGADVWAWPRAQRLTGRAGLSARTSGRAEESGSDWLAGPGWSVRDARAGADAVGGSRSSAGKRCG